MKRKYLQYAFVVYEFIAMLMNIPICFAMCMPGGEFGKDMVILFTILLVHNAITMWLLPKITLKPYWTNVILALALPSTAFFVYVGIDRIWGMQQNTNELLIGIAITLYALLVIACRIMKRIIAFRCYRAREIHGGIHQSGKRL